MSQEQAPGAQAPVFPSKQPKASLPKLEKLSAVKGMNDILPPESARWEWLEATLRELMARFAYRNIRTPVLEHTALFVRGIGEVTDIVEKEMYSFEDRLNGEHLTLRPEFTAGIVRATIEHNLTYEGPRRVWSIGPVFRHERPQPGHAITSGVKARNPIVCRISCATWTSRVRDSPGAGVKDTRIVSPMPSCSSTDSAAVDATMPLLPMPASVRPRCSG